MAYFQGKYTGEHYEMEVKNMTKLQKFMLYLLGGLICLDIILGVCGLFYYLVTAIGITVIYLIFFALELFPISPKNPAILTFFILGIATTAVGLILVLDLFDPENLLFSFLLYSPIIFVILGIILIMIGYSHKKEHRNCTYRVTATCQTVDIRTVRLFGFDNYSNRYDSTLDQDEVYRPAYTFWYNGQQFFVEDKYYYGNGNTDFYDGNQIDLMINPSNPADFIPVNMMSNIESIMGWLFLIIGVAAQVGILIMNYNGLLSLN